MPLSEAMALSSSPNASATRTPPAWRRRRWPRRSREAAFAVALASVASSRISPPNSEAEASLALPVATTWLAVGVTAWLVSSALSSRTAPSLSLSSSAATRAGSSLTVPARAGPPSVGVGMVAGPPMTGCSGFGTGMDGRLGNVAEGRRQRCRLRHDRRHGGVDAGDQGVEQRGQPDGGQRAEGGVGHLAGGLVRPGGRGDGRGLLPDGEAEGQRVGRHLDGGGADRAGARQAGGHAAAQGSEQRRQRAVGDQAAAGEEGGGLRDGRAPGGPDALALGAEQRELDRVGQARNSGRKRDDERHDARAGRRRVLHGIGGRRGRRPP